MRMGNDLTVMMLIEVDPSRSTLLTAALQGGALLSDYKIFTHTLDPAGLAAPEQGAPRKSSRFSMAAPDKPGLIHLVTSAPCPPRACAAAAAAWACGRASR